MVLLAYVSLRRPWRESPGGYALAIFWLRYNRGMGLGEFIHTGNECDLQVTDFLDYFGKDPQVRGL